MEIMLLIDEQAIPHCPTSRFLTREEIKHLYPDQSLLPHRKSFIFKHQKPLPVERNLARELIKKYSSLIAVDENHKPLSLKDDLDDMKYNELVNLCARMGGSLTGKKQDVINEIRRLREQGVVPISKEEFIKQRDRKNLEAALKSQKQKKEQEKEKTTPKKRGRKPGRKKKNA